MEYLIVLVEALNKTTMNTSDIVTQLIRSDLNSAQ